MEVSHVLNCMLSSWYPQFKEVTIKTRILNIPQEFMDYLHTDGIVLPEGCIKNHEDGEIDSEAPNVDWDETEKTIVAEAPSFPEFEAEIKKSIRVLGGKVFPKLNWSSPKDANWISFDNTLNCTCPSDVYLLLKSSQFITHDITQPFQHCTDFDPTKKVDFQYQLALRRWHDINPAGEFRCFVKDNKLIGICQRHSSMFYNNIVDEKKSILADLKAFFYHVVSEKFQDSKYIFDVYRKHAGKVYLIDFNPFSHTTDTLLFTMEELNQDKALASTDQAATNEPVFRFVESESGVQPSPYKSYALPQDFVDLSTGEDPYKLMDFLQLKIQSQNDESSSDSENEPSTAPPEVINTNNSQKEMATQHSKTDSIEKTLQDSETCDVNTTSILTKPD